jgi:hypothetical protein
MSKARAISQWSKQTEHLLRLRPWRPMNLRAKCVNKNCPAFGIEKSVMLGRLAGFGAPNDRVFCPSCGELMRTTKSINTSKGKAFRKLVSRTYNRSSVSRRRPKRTTKRMYKRGGGKRI